MSRAFAGLAVLLLLVFIIAPASAEAWIELYQYSYGPNEILWVDLGFIDFWPNLPPGEVGITDSWMGLNVRARSYVVPHGSVTDDGQNLDSLMVEPFNVIVQPSSTSGFWDEPLGMTRPQGKIPNGLFDIVIDEWENGKYDDGIDDIVATISVSGTTALGVQLNPAITALKHPTDGIAVREYNRWKLNRDRTKSFENGVKWIEGLQIVANLALNVWAWYGGIVPQYDWIVDEVVNRGLQPPEKCAIPTRGEVFDQIEMMQTAMVDHWEAIKNDPPDPNFTVDVPLAPVAQTEAESPYEMTQAMSSFANTGSQQAAVLQALLKSLEKFQGARDAGNHLYSIKQARNVAKYARLAAVLASETALNANRFANSAAGIQEDFVLAHARLEEMQSRLSPDGSGFNPAEMAALQGIGLAPSDYAALAQSILSDSFSDKPVAELLESASALASDVAASQQMLLSLAQSADQEAATWLPLTTPFPAASAGGPYSGATGTPVTLSATATVDTDTPLASLSFAWDTDCDGQFDDVTGPSPQFTYSRAYDGLVGVFVQDPDGNSDIAYARMQIHTVNASPVANQSPSSLRLSVVPLQTTHLSVDPEDADHDPLQVTWFVDGSQIPSGSLSMDYTPASGQTGLHLVTAVVSDNNTSSPDGVAEWVIMVAQVPQITLSGSFLDFSNTTPGSESEQTIRITNNGSAPLNISAPAIRPGGSGDFAVAGPLFPSVIPSGESMDITINCRPTSSGFRGAVVEFSTNDLSNQLVTLPIFHGAMTTANQCKTQGVGQCAVVRDVKVTAVWPGQPWTAYVQSQCMSGLRIEGVGDAPALNSVLRVVGMMSRSGAESSLSAVDIGETGTAEIKPAGMSLRLLGGGSWHFDPIIGSGQQGVDGGSGPNNDGLLVRIFGRVTNIGNGYIYVDDGSHLSDGTYTDHVVNKGVRILCDPAELEEGRLVAVVGICSCFETDLGKPRRLLQTRTQEDIVAIQ